MEVLIKLIKSLISSTMAGIKYHQGDKLFVGEMIWLLPVSSTAECVQHPCSPAPTALPVQIRGAVVPKGTDQALAPPASKPSSFLGRATHLLVLPRAKQSLLGRPA